MRKLGAGLGAVEGRYTEKDYRFKQRQHQQWVMSSFLGSREFLIAVLKIERSWLP